MASALMTLEQAMAQGLTAVRKSHWKPKERLVLDRVGKRYGAWGTIVCSSPKARRGDALRQVSLLIEGDSDEDWIEFNAP